MTPRWGVMVYMEALAIGRRNRTESGPNEPAGAISAELDGALPMNGLIRPAAHDSGVRPLASDTIVSVKRVTDLDDSESPYAMRPPPTILNMPSPALRCRR